MAYVDRLMKSMAGDFGSDVAFLIQTHDKMSAAIQPKLRRGEVDKETYSALCDKILPTRMAIFACLYLGALKAENFEDCEKYSSLYNKTEKILDGLRRQGL